MLFIDNLLMNKIYCTLPYSYGLSKIEIYKNSFNSITFKTNFKAEGC